MEWYHVMDICKYHAEWNKVENLDFEPHDNLNEALIIAKGINKLVRTAKADYSDDPVAADYLSDIEDYADDLERLDNSAVEKALASGRDIAELCKDQFFCGLQTHHRVTSLIELLSTYNKESSPEAINQVLDLVKEDLKEAENELSSNFVNGVYLDSFMIQAGWSRRAQEAVGTLFKGIDYLYVESKPGESKHYLSYKVHEGEATVRLNGDSISLYYRKKIFGITHEGNIRVCSDVLNRQVANFKMEELETCFLDPFNPTESEICMFGMINKFADEMRTIEICREGLALFSK